MNETFLFPSFTISYVSLEPSADYMRLYSTSDGATFNQLFSTDSNAGQLASPAIVDTVIPSGQFRFTSNGLNNYDGIYMTYSVQPVCHFSSLKLFLS